jgi:hypothetical protein
MPSDDQPPTGTDKRVAHLSEADSEAVDRLLESGLDPDAPPSGDPRDAAVLELLGLLDDYPVEPAAQELVDATLARVAREEADQAARMSFQNAPRVSERRTKIPDFFAVAAAMFLAVGIGLPLYQVIDGEDKLTQSQNRLNGVGQAVAGFSEDFSDLLPLQKGLLTNQGGQLDPDMPCPIRGDWSGNLRMLSDQGYCDARLLHLIGPDGTRSSQVAYRVPFSRKTFRLQSGPHTSDEILLSDPNPVAEAMRRSERPGSHTIGSSVHDFDHVVVLKFDLSLDTLQSAVLSNGDSLWVHHGYDPDRLDQPFWPSDPADELLAH